MAKYEEIGKCLNCGEEFKKHTRRHMFCSSRCKEAHRLKQLEWHDGVCKGCGAPIRYKLNHGKPTREYCSAPCQLKHTVPTKMLTCVDCGREFEFRGRTKKLRCDECWHKHRSENAMANRALRDPSVQVGIGSGGGQNLDTAIPDEIRASANAARRAKYAAHREAFRMIAKSRYREKKLAESSECAICGYHAHVECLVVHHINMDRTDNRGENLVVLCANCHMWLHKEIKRRQKVEQITAESVYNQVREAEVKERNKAGTPDRAIRTEGLKEFKSGATHSSTSRSDMNCHEAAPLVEDLSFDF